MIQLDYKAIALDWIAAWNRLDIDGMTIIYKRETGVMVADVVVINQQGKGVSVKAYYG
jgi:hypothetical protein